MREKKSTSRRPYDTLKHFNQCSISYGMAGRLRYAHP